MTEPDIFAQLDTIDFDAAPHELLPALNKLHALAPDDYSRGIVDGIRYAVGLYLPQLSAAAEATQQEPQQAFMN